MKSDTPLSPPRGPLSPKQQSEAIRRVTEQAQQRVQLGMQLFKAAEAYTTHQQDLLREFKGQQESLRDQIQKDVASTLQTYDQWMARFDQSFTRSLAKLEKKVDTLQHQWEASQLQIATLTRRAESLLDQSRVLLESISQKAASSKAAPAKPVATAKATPAKQQTKPSSKPASPPAAKTITPAPAGSKKAIKKTPAPKTSPPPSTPQSNAIYRKAVEQLREGAADDLLSGDEAS